MGLIDEAIGEFQAALSAGEERLKVYEELGRCFMLKDQYNVALKVLTRALKVPHRDETELIGVHYLLGTCYEKLGHRLEAREAYERVLAMDDSFEDVPERLTRL
jgi:tetratricopeptide (TPR) repeat protein